MSAHPFIQYSGLIIDLEKTLVDKVNTIRPMGLSHRSLFISIKIRF